MSLLFLNIFSWNIRVWNSRKLRTKHRGEKTRPIEISKNEISDISFFFQPPTIFRSLKKCSTIVGNEWKWTLYKSENMRFSKTFFQCRPSAERKSNQVDEVVCRFDFRFCDTNETKKTDVNIRRFGKLLKRQRKIYCFSDTYT